MPIGDKYKLAIFLAQLPVFMQKALWREPMSQRELMDYLYGTAPQTLAEEQVDFYRSMRWEPDPRRFDEGKLRKEFEEILQGCDSCEWVKYVKNTEDQRKQSADLIMPIPRRKPGRKRNDELAERIRVLRDAGKKNREIQELLRGEGWYLSLEAIEAYRKTRRMPQPR